MTFGRSIRYRLKFTEHVKDGTQASKQFILPCMILGTKGKMENFYRNRLYAIDELQLQVYQLMYYLLQGKSVQ